MTRRFCQVTISRHGVRESCATACTTAWAASQWPEGAQARLPASLSRAANREVWACRRHAPAHFEAKRARAEERMALGVLDKSGGVFAALVSCAMERGEVRPEAAARFYLDEEQSGWWGDGSPGTIAHLVNGIEAAIIEDNQRRSRKDGAR